MTPCEYIDTLTPEEMRFIILQFWDWRNENGCPMSEGCADEFDCRRDFPEGWDEECDEDYREQCGCWVRFYAWKYHRFKKKVEKFEAMGKEGEAK